MHSHHADEPTNSRWKFFTQPHPAIVVIVLIASCLMLWRSGSLLSKFVQPTGTPMGDEGIVTAITNQTTQYNDLVNRTTTYQTLKVHLNKETSDKTVDAGNDVAPVRVGARVYVAFDDTAKNYSVTQISRVDVTLYLVIGFFLVVLLVSGGYGARSLIGLLWSGAVLAVYTLPQLLSGANPVHTGVISAFVILIVSLYISHGVNRKTIAAVIGLAVTLTFVAVLAIITTHYFAFTGVAGEDAFLLQGVSKVPLDYVGLLVAGIIIAGVGVLDDIALTQSATVFALAESAQHLKGLRLFRKAMAVGHDHISAVVNTLIMAYAGAALPLIMLMVISGQGVAMVVNTEVVAQEVVQTLVSSIGLVLAVPLTTLLATFFADRRVIKKH